MELENLVNFFAVEGQGGVQEMICDEVAASGVEPIAPLSEEDVMHTCVCASCGEHQVISYWRTTCPMCGSKIVV